jgi:hypothetical protein
VAHKTQVLTVAQIRQREEYLASGRVWPPAEEHCALQERNKDLEEQVMKLTRHQKMTPQERHKTLDEIVRKYGIEPAEELIRMCAERAENGAYILSPDQRIKILTELQQYRMPKLKSIEMQGTVDHTLTVVVKKFGDHVQEKVVRTFDIESDVKPMKR